MKISAWLSGALGALALAGTANAQIVEFDIDAIIQATRTPAPSLVLLAAHRGLWQSVPENSIEAIEAARVANFETIEIDVRLSNDGTPWLIHDFSLERLTNGIGYLSMNRDSTLELLRLRNRDGTLSDVPPVKLEQAFDYFAKQLTLHPDGKMTGFVLVVDLKAPPKADPNAARVSGYEALKKSWEVLKAVSARYPNLSRPDANGLGLGRAVIFKLKGRDLPDPAQLERDLGISPATNYFRVEPVLHSDDADAGNRVITQYFGKGYAVGFEAVLEYFGQQPATAWTEKLRNNGRTIPGFPGWSDYPEGVAFSTGACCLRRNTDPADQKAPLDYSASIEFQLQNGANWLTADTVPVLNALLAAHGLRDLSPITYNPRAIK